MLVGLGIVVWNVLEVEKPVEDRSDMANNGTSTISTGDVAPGAVDVSTIVEPKRKPPVVDSPLLFPKSFDAKAREMATKEIAILEASVTKDPKDLNSWLSLALYRKMLDDFTGALDIWDYTSQLQPGSSLSFLNMGTVYAYHLNDNVKGEAYFKEAMERGQMEVNVYDTVARFYVDRMKDYDKARLIYDKGIEAMPMYAGLLRQSRDLLPQ